VDEVRAYGGGWTKKIQVQKTRKIWRSQLIEKYGEMLARSSYTSQKKILQKTDRQVVDITNHLHTGETGIRSGWGVCDQKKGGGWGEVLYGREGNGVTGGGKKKGSGCFEENLWGGGQGGRCKNRSKGEG